MIKQPALPILKIQGDRDALLAPYRHAVANILGALIEPGDESALKNIAIRGADQRFVDAWDAAFATIGLRWAGEGVSGVADPFLAALDPSGYVPSKLELATGGNPPDSNERNRIAAPLTAWAEWELFKLRGNRERLEHAFALLKADFYYREDHNRKRNGLVAGVPEPYKLGATGRFTLGGRVVPSLANGASWIDASCMYALNARVLGDMARVLGRREDAGELEWTMRDLAAKVNARMWSNEDNWYHDLDEHGAALPMQTLAGFWAVLSGVAPRSSAEAMIKALNDPTRFERSHPWATVSATESDYRGRDGVPLGVARADFNLLVCEALFAAHHHTTAQRGIEQHLKRASKVLADSGGLYLAHDPDKDMPAPLPDGSSGEDSPLAMACCFQNTLGGLMGLRPHGHRGELELVPYLEEGHTIENLSFAFGTVNMDVHPADKTGARRTIEVMTDVPFKLRTRTGDKSFVHDIQPGMHTINA
jgi:hypothetical protein